MALFDLKSDFSRPEKPYLRTFYVFNGIWSNFEKSSMSIEHLNRSNFRRVVLEQSTDGLKA